MWPQEWKKERFRKPKFIINIGCRRSHCVQREFSVRESSRKETERESKNGHVAVTTGYHQNNKQINKQTQIKSQT
jgi:hypothetical protein